MSGWTFLTQFAKNPKTLGSVVPSSPFLGQMMVEAANVGADDVVVELGAGTGAITREIVARHPFSHLLCLEPNPKLATAFRKKLPGVPLVEGYAQDLPEILAQWGHQRVDRVISGLPFTLWDRELLEPIFDALVECMTPNARLVTFTYVHSQVLPQARVLREVMSERFNSVQKTPIEWANVPPAYCFVCDAPVAAGMKEAV